jgi:hypothetical protein
MKTLLFSNQGLSPSHLGIELEILEAEIAQQNEIKILYCKSNLESCFFNASHNLLACSICEARSKVFYGKIGIKKSQLTPLQNLVSSFNLNPIHTTDDIFEIKYKGFDIGRGIAASYISTRRNYEYDHSDFEFIKEMAFMCANVVDNILHQIKAYQPDKVILFNGRFAEQNAIIEVCQLNHLDYYTFERSSAPGKYKYFKNMLPHSLKHRATEIDRLWNVASKSERTKISSDWFESRQKGGTGLIKKFLAKQEHGVLPENFNHEKHNIAIFITSEDEHKTVKEHHFDQYDNQNEAIIKVLNRIKENTQIQFYLRVHPHLRNIDSAQTKEIKTLNFSNLTVINAEEKIDTYSLMQACDKVLTFGSTTGIEAAFLERPSILFGHSYYESLDCAYYPKTYDELIPLLQDFSLTAKPKENTLPFSFYQSTIGIEYSKYVDGGKNNSFYGLEPIKRIYPKTLAIITRNFKDYSQWKKMNNLIFKAPLTRKNMFKLNSHVLSDKLK